MKKLLINIVVQDF